jgi:hypothetical protein
VYILLFQAKCKSECILQAASVLYILFLLGTPAIANPDGESCAFFIDLIIIIESEKLICFNR